MTSPKINHSLDKVQIMTDKQFIFKDADKHYDNYSKLQHMFKVEDSKLVKSLQGSSYTKQIVQQFSELDRIYNQMDLD